MKVVRYEYLTLDVESDASEAYMIVGAVVVAYVCRILDVGHRPGPGFVLGLGHRTGVDLDQDLDQDLVSVNNISYCTGQSVGSRIPIWSTT